MAELKRCPECGGVATVIHMYNTYDREDFGWDAGCGRYRAGDGLHTRRMKVSGLPRKEKAIEAWNRMVDNCEWMKMLAEESVDAVPVVRCKDCKYRDGTPGQPNILCAQMHEDDFCSYGECREDKDG